MQCSGCSACSVICPKHCISMEINDKGFMRPVVNEVECIHCNLCKKVCFFNHRNTSSLDSAELYSAYSIDKQTRETTSSGGVAYLISKKAINNHEIVCGASFNYSTFTVQHELCYTDKAIENLKGSKYLQSNCGNAFSDLLKVIKKKSNQKAVIFGTPCQIAGLNNVLEKCNLRDRVLLVDIFCHGVPSEVLWKNYLNYLEKKEGVCPDQISKIIFRDKKYSWHSYYMHIYYANGEYIKSRKTDPFLKLFSMGFLNQKECFTCPLRNESAADIRLGDFWGKRYANSEEGYSMVLLLTDKGKQYFDSLPDMEKINLPIEERFGQQHTDYIIPEKYDEGFALLLNNESLKRIIDLYDPPSKRLIRELKGVAKLLLKR